MPGCVTRIEPSKDALVHWLKHARLGDRCQVLTAKGELYAHLTKLKSATAKLPMTGFMGQEHFPNHKKRTVCNFPTKQTSPSLSVDNAFPTRGIVMPINTTPQRVYPDEHGQAVIVCPQCVTHTPIDANPYLGSHKALKVGGSYGNRFPVVFDTRKFYRKAQ